MSRVVPSASIASAAARSKSTSRGLVMWALRNKTPYQAERSWVQDRDANKIWIVVVKATFDVLPTGEIRRADEQVPVHRLGVHARELGASRLRYEADLLGVK